LSRPLVDLLSETEALPPQERVDALVRLAWSLEGDEAETAYTQAAAARSLAESMGYKAGVGEALLVMASISERSGEYRRSMEQALEALALFERLENPQKACSAIYLLGWNYYNLGDYPTGMRWAVRQLRMAEAARYPRGEAEAHNLMGALLSATDDQYESSVTHYQQSLAIYRALGETEDEAVLLNNLCVSYEYMGRYREALECGVQALELSRQNSNTHSEALALGNLGVVYVELGEYARALELYTRRLTVTRERGYASLETHTLLCIGRLYVRQQQWDAALPYVQNALAQAEALEYRKWVFEGHEQLALIYEGQGRLAEALAHYKQYHKLEYDTLNDQTRTQVERLKLAYDLDKMEADLARERAQREADRLYFERMNALKDRLINTASHDLKSPLTSIFLALDLLERLTHESDPRVHDLLQRLRHNTRHMQEMIEHLLDRALLESGRALVYTTVTLPTFLAEALRDVEGLAAAKAITLSLDAPPLTVRVDSQRMRQALNNLLSNAIKYSPAGAQVHLTAAVEAGGLRLRVRDTGYGIPVEALPHLFEPFFRVDKAEHRAAEGTGLGLSIVQSIVEQHGGTIRVESAEGVGTTFTITLPDAVVEAETE
jgi:signal transduction histidine kinase